MALRTSTTSGSAILTASLLLSLALLFLSLHCYHKDKDTDFNLYSRRLLVSTTDLLDNQDKKHHHHHHHRHHQKNDRHSQTVNVPAVLPGHRPKPSPDPGDDEIDPRYGVQKRLVPTGPNPLHH